MQATRNTYKIPSLYTTSKSGVFDNLEHEDIHTALRVIQAFAEARANEPVGTPVHRMVIQVGTGKKIYEPTDNLEMFWRNVQQDLNNMHTRVYMHGHGIGLHDAVYEDLIEQVERNVLEYIESFEDE